MAPTKRDASKSIESPRVSWNHIQSHLQRFAGFQEKWRATCTLVADAFLELCSPAKVLNKLAPHENMAVHDGIAYGNNPRQKLDVYAPATQGRGPVPIVVFFHGGSWMTGERSIYRFIGAALAASGMMVVIPDYRLYPQVTFPGFMYDAADAVAWTRAHADDLGGDPSNIFLMGHSAGAQIATLLALDGAYLKTKQLTPNIVSGVIGLAGPYDFLPLTDPVYMKIFGPQEGWPASQPINYVTKSAPPMFLATGLKDDLVNPNNTHRFAAKLQSQGVETTVKVYSRAGHMTIVGAFASQLDLFAPVRRDALDFIAAHKVVKRNVRSVNPRRAVKSLSGATARA